MTFPAPQCWSCKHFKDDGSVSCDAFPNGIPGDIILNIHDHHKPYKGDNGITYERKK